MECLRNLKPDNTYYKQIHKGILLRVGKDDLDNDWAWLLGVVGCLVPVTPILMILSYFLTGLFWNTHTIFLIGDHLDTEIFYNHKNVIKFIIVIFLIVPLAFLLDKIPIIGSMFSKLVDLLSLYPTALSKWFNKDLFESTEYADDTSPNQKRPSSGRERFEELFNLESGWTTADLKSAYRKFSMDYHPDRAQHLGREFIELAERRMKEINEAYAFLGKLNQNNKNSKP